MSAEEIKKWLDTLNPKSIIVVDDGGLTLVELDQAGNETGAYLELGGTPDGVWGDQAADDFDDYRSQDDAK